MRTGGEGTVSEQILLSMEATLDPPAMPVKGESRKDGEGMTVGPAGFSLLNLPCAADAHRNGEPLDVLAALPDGHQRTCYVFTTASFRLRL